MCMDECHPSHQRRCHPFHQSITRSSHHIHSAMGDLLMGLPTGVGLVALTTAVTACAGEILPNTSPEHATPSTAHTFLAPSSRADSLDLVLDVAKHLAFSLSDREVRSDLAAALKRTTARESKLHLQRFLKNRGKVWGERVSEKNGLGKAGWKGELDLLPGMEVYLPVEAHRRTWKGTADILVLGEIRDEADIRQAGGYYTAFDIHGNELKFLMDAPPPERPVLSVVPVETSFGDDGESSGGSLSGAAADSSLANMCDNTCPPPGGGGPGDILLGDSLVLYKSSIIDVQQYEGWGAGSPEIMVLLKAYNPSTGHYSSVINCAGDGVAAPRGFNQDGNTWNGRAHMAITPQLGPYIDNQRAPTFWVYENDSGSSCDFEPTEHEDIAASVAVLAGLSTGIGINQIIKLGTPAAWAYTIASAVMGIAAYWHAVAGDEFIGLVTVPEGSNPATMTKSIMHDEAPVVRGRLWMQFRPNN
jgi:hypothetical protein